MYQEKMTKYQSIEMTGISNQPLLIESSEELVELQTIKIPTKTTHTIRQVTLDLHLRSTQEILKIIIPGFLLHKIANKNTDRNYRYCYLRDLLLLSHNSFLCGENAYARALPIVKLDYVVINLISDTIFTYKLVVAIMSFNVSIRNQKFSQTMNNYIDMMNCDIKKNSDTYTITYVPQTNIRLKGFFIEMEPYHQLALSLKSAAPNNDTQTIGFNIFTDHLSIELQWKDTQIDTLYNALFEYAPQEIISMMNEWCSMLSPPLGLHWFSMTDIRYDSLYNSRNFVYIAAQTHIEITVQTTKISNFSICMEEELTFT